MFQVLDNFQGSESQSVYLEERPLGSYQAAVLDQIPTVPVYFDTLPDGLIADEI